MDNFEFYKELYHKENERRQEVLNSLNIPIAVITALSTGIYFLVTSFDYHVENFLNLIFLGLIGISTICTLIAIYYLIRAFSDFTKGYEYTGIPYPQELYDWNNELKEYYLKIGGAENDAQNHFKNYLTENLVKHIDHNMYINDKKHEFIYSSKRFLVVGLIFMLFTLIPFGYNYFNQNTKTQKIEILSTPTEIKQNFQKFENKLDSIKTIINQNNLNNERREQKDSTASTTTSSKGQVD